MCPMQKIIIEQTWILEVSSRKEDSLRQALEFKNDIKKIDSIVNTLRKKSLKMLKLIADVVNNLKTNKNF